MERAYGRITAWGAYVPENIVTNFDLEKTLDTSNEWIVQRTGILERRIAGPDETTATLATNAGRAALARAGLSARDLDLIIVATSTPDHLTPPVSSQVQHMLGATSVPAFVLVTGCTGFVYALATAQQFIASGTFKTILVIGAELLSRHIDWQDRSTCVLFGDAAGASVVEASPVPGGVLAFELGSDGSRAQHIVAPAAGTAEPVSERTFADRRQFIRMNGREVFKFATRVIAESSHRVMARANMTLEEIDWIIPHQANLRIIQSAARGMGIPTDRFYVNIHKYANTSAASIPLAICEGLDSGQIKPDDTLLAVSFGAGLTWAAAIIQLIPCLIPMARQEAALVSANGRVRSLSAAPVLMD
jgi:3-oxoacyl-[acyl-carrier-protein] synthase-3